MCETEPAEPVSHIAAGGIIVSNLELVHSSSGVGAHNQKH
jgi:hypothetical protein